MTRKAEPHQNKDWSSFVDPCLQDLQDRIDENQEQLNYDSWVAFLDDRCPDEIFIPPARQPSPPRCEWPEVTVNEALEDQTAMLLQQFKGCSDVLTRGGGSRLNVRCNYGIGILPSLFGCEIFLMDESTDTLPAAKPLASTEKIKALLDKGIPELTTGLGSKVFQMAQVFLGIFQKYPILRRHVHLYHPDLQGPIDVAEVVWGSDIFYAFHDQPDLVRDILKLLTDTYIVFMRRWYDLVGQPGLYSAHWGMLQKGAVMIRDDSLMNLSPQIYQDLVRPLDQQIFRQFGRSGAIHFCGRGDHYIQLMSEIPGLTAVAMSQPKCNNMETIYCHTVDKNIKLIGFSLEHARKSNRPLRGQVQCFLPDKT